jgi:hypothetical protein
LLISSFIQLILVIFSSGAHEDKEVEEEEKV